MNNAKCRFAGAITLAVVLAVCSSAAAQNGFIGGFLPDGRGDRTCPAVVFDWEATFMEFCQEGGVTDAGGQTATFDRELAPRFELAYVRPGGLGVRSRYWDFDAYAYSTDGDIVDVDTYYTDLELFQEYRLTRHTTLECALGARYANFGQYLTNSVGDRAYLGSFDGFGGTLAVEVNRQVWIGSVYARGRFSILTGDGTIATRVISTGATTYDSARSNSVTQTELGIGYEVRRGLGDWGILNLRVGAEWQQWANVAVGDTAFGGVGNDDVLEDASFAGLVFGLGLER